jgi:hypothetical protein
VLDFEPAAVKHGELSGSFCAAAGVDVDPVTRITTSTYGSACGFGEYTGPMGAEVGGKGAQPARIQVLGHRREQCRIWEEEIPTFAARVSLSLPIHARRGREWQSVIPRGLAGVNQVGLAIVRGGVDGHCGQASTKLQTGSTFVGGW